MLWFVCLFALSFWLLFGLVWCTIPKLSCAWIWPGWVSSSWHIWDCTVTTWSRERTCFATQGPGHEIKVHQCFQKGTCIVFVAKTKEILRAFPCTFLHLIPFRLFEQLARTCRKRDRDFIKSRFERRQAERQEKKEHFCPQMHADVQFTRECMSHAHINVTGSSSGMLSHQRIKRVGWLQNDTKWYETCFERRMLHPHTAPCYPMLCFDCHRLVNTECSARPNALEEYTRRTLSKSGKAGWQGGRDLPSSATWTYQFCSALLTAWNNGLSDEARLAHVPNPVARDSPASDNEVEVVGEVIAIFSQSSSDSEGMSEWSVLEDESECVCARAHASLDALNVAQLSSEFILGTHVWTMLKRIWSESQSCNRMGKITFTLIQITLTWIGWIYVLGHTIL